MYILIVFFIKTGDFNWYYYSGYLLTGDSDKSVTFWKTILWFEIHKSKKEYSDNSLLGVLVQNLRRGTADSSKESPSGSSCFKETGKTISHCATKVKQTNPLKRRSANTGSVEARTKESWCQDTGEVEAEKRGIGTPSHPYKTLFYQNSFFERLTHGIRSSPNNA